MTPHQDSPLTNLDVFKTPLIEDQTLHQRFIRKAGALYGAIVAIGFALFFWLPDALLLQQAHYQWWWAKLVLGLIMAVPISILIGWLAASMRWAGLSILVWIAGGVILAWIGGRLQFDGISWLARFTDPYPSDRIMYPFSQSAQAFTGISMVVGAGAGLFLGLIAMIAQERAWDASTKKYGFSVKSVAMLCLCLPAVLLLGLLADFQINSSARGALTSVAELIETARDPNVDLVHARLGPMATYRANMSPNYTLFWNTITGDLVRSSIDVQFDTGLLLRCPYAHDNVLPCSNLGTQLIGGMQQLATVGHLTCKSCNVQVDRDTRRWLNAIVPTLGELQTVDVLQHHGGWIYLRATYDGGRKIDCRFSGDRPIVVDLCVEAKE